MQEVVSEGGFARVGQLMLLLFFVPFNLFLIYVVGKNFSLDGLIFASIIASVSILIVRNGFSYGDVYLTEHSITIKKLFTNQKKQLSQFNKIQKALCPFTYYIEFEDKEKVYFIVSLKNMGKEAISLDPDIILKELRQKFWLLKENRENPTANHT